MRSSARVSTAVLVLFLFLQTAPAAAQPKPTAEANDATRQLHALFAEEWENRLREAPTFASMMGDRRWNDRWADMSLAAIESRQQRARETLKKLRAIARGELSPADQLNYDLFEKSYQTGIDEQQYRLYLIPLTQRGGPQTVHELADSLRFTTVKDYDDWLARMRALPEYMGQVTELMQAGIKARIVQPRIVMERVPAQIAVHLVDDPTQSPFYKRFERFPDSIPEAEQKRLTAEARQVIAEHVAPAYRKFHDFFTSQYLPATFEQVGAWQLPRGQELYATLARRFTTTDMTPEQIHHLGLHEVARIRQQMEDIKAKVGFEGTLQEFFEFLRTDPQFYYETGEELLKAYRAMAKRIDPEMVKLFRTLPRAPYGVEPIPMAIAPDTTTAYYRQPAPDGSRAGTYFVNLYQPESRPKYEMMALSLHEAVPGHHLQIARAQELGEIPNFRRFGGYTAFSEGWGLYAESLGEDAGLYDDPYDKFGQLTYEMWRAVRLVVDTGMHHFRWDRKRAIDYFMDNAAKVELDVINEIDRYIAWPGQALAYKIGELKFKELRARATQKLGERFDLRDFHDFVLGSGAVPLDVLERKVVAWIAEQAKAAGAAAP
jgi:uncharacterized protein (DUF885 family)